MIPENRANRLAGETSPYLLQHAHNPVDWYPWGPEALERARQLDRPIFLSIGYAACHWCHVMERESFEDGATARQLNADFVAIKVDREERPDLDQVYMTAVQAMTGQGGWPMSLFLTPDGRPFYGGTYFPDSPRHGLPSFREVLTAVASAWRLRRDELEAAGSRLIESLAHQHGQVAGSDGLPDPRALDLAVTALEATFDATNGGWGGAPKFPQSMTIEFLLRRWAVTGDARALAMARLTLDRMADGGIHDQLGGGFHRYATDAIWLVPHFEKMLYDNAQLARAYVHAFEATGDERYAAVVRDTLAYVRRELTTSDGLWAASEDADTDGEEGLTYVWDLPEVESILGPDAELFAKAFDVSARGNWEGTTILRRVRSDEELARDLGRPPGEVSRRLVTARSTLLAVRNQRSQPARDDKALAAWNGLMLAAFADAGRVFSGRPEGGEAALGATWIDLARSAAARALEVLRGPDGSLARSWKDGRASQRGVLEDAADLAEGLLALYEATFEERWFVAARGLIDDVLAHFTDPAGGFFDTSDEHEVLVTRPKDVQDNAVPSGNAMAATVLLKLAALTGDQRYRDAAERAIGQVGRLVERYPGAFAQWLVAIEFALAPVMELAIVGDPEDPATRRLLEPARSGFRPHQVIAVAADGMGSAIELLHGRPRIEGRPTAYVCRGFACRRPTTHPGQLAIELAAATAQ